MTRARDKARNDGYYVRKTVVQTTPSTGYSFSTSWTLAVTFDNIPDITGNSIIEMDYLFPCRNDSASWGGVYIEPQVSFNGGTSWSSLGSSGYDGGVMHLSSQDIGSYYNSMTIDPGISTSFNVRFRFYMRAYDGTSTVNVANDINVLSGTATLLSGNNGLQHYGRINVREIAKR
jgi:hypothetical protein